jgi:hypothetical protein
MSRSRSLRSAPARANVPQYQALFGPVPAAPAELDVSRAAPPATELFIWFEDNRHRRVNESRGAAGFPECLLPYDKGMRVLDRRYVEGHVHLLAAARIRCDERLAECVAAIYTTALALGTIAWIGTGEQYRRAWKQMYPRKIGGPASHRAKPSA